MTMMAAAMSSGRSINTRSWPIGDVGDARRGRPMSWRTTTRAVNGNAVLAPERFPGSGSLLERSSYCPRRNVESFSIRSYEVGENRKISIATLANLLQEVACNHARNNGFSVDGFATTLSMRKYGLIWVITRIQIEVEEYPKWGDNIEIDSWFQFQGKNGTRRDWRVTNTRTGKVIARATSTFALMNQQTRRLARINDDVRNEFCLYVLHPPSWVFVDDAVTKPISKLSEYQHVKENLKPSLADLDMNQHVNNATYMNWILESLPREVYSKNELHSMTLEFRCECKRENTINACSSLEINDTNDESSSTFTHLLYLVGSNKELKNFGFSKILIED
ncbi:hypothetical protein SELMODRAFT_444039 [Selaginella moellendorffii]|uniref:Acyl-[acyl-carrier-protein] hydrolase n=1 Tax=Selaginella moellendorffii TaxID=88036 RepID=D8S6U0_SELML|nr:hypothetical protein SELMODRAFT_444039 [Selaginella moellendorffii]